MENNTPVIDINNLIGSMKVYGFKFQSTTQLGTIIGAALPIIYGLAGFGLLIYLVLGGFKYLTSTGDPKKIEEAKGAITTAIIGFLIIFVAFWITQIINFVFHLGAGV